MDAMEPRPWDLDNSWHKRLVNDGHWRDIWDAYCKQAIEIIITVLDYCGCFFRYNVSSLEVGGPDSITLML